MVGHVGKQGTGGEPVTVQPLRRRAPFQAARAQQACTDEYRGIDAHAAVVFGLHRTSHGFSRGAHAVTQRAPIGIERERTHIRVIRRHRLRARAIGGSPPHRNASIHECPVVDPAPVGRPDGRSLGHQPAGVLPQRNAAVGDTKRRRAALQRLHVPDRVVGIALHAGLFQPIRYQSPVWRDHRVPQVRHLDQHARGHAAGARAAAHQNQHRKQRGGGPTAWPHADAYRHCCCVHHATTAGPQRRSRSARWPNSWWNRTAHPSAPKACTAAGAG